MQVEVSVQDVFHESTSAPIALETWETWFDRWLTALAPTDGEGDPLHPNHVYELSLRLTDDREIHTLNRDFRQKDQPTDVLSFAALEVDAPELPEEEPLYLGDIIISVETAERQAVSQGHPLKVELAWLAAHGLLHLLGWDHPDDESLERMLNQQQALLQMVDLSGVLL
ncbi:rRNA maturation RNase YbeY [Alkalinema sp. FACHB-956]|uniref:rRNA maturation RNase YbeY n=1 Tax=Alkalinema sp. FACHB-956 TaxID=2692768 RepID=UPI001689537F|nr:rRNA maturation RNase YbeY [Alkalinema sp. FACHB-956]MBD2326775.1 rRNA maturation RNase YbeY [Alkalinema sp. FACHB-956]